MRAPDGWCPISDYAFLSDCRSAALVAKDGSVDWLCWPRFDSPSLFARVLDPDLGGYFEITPVGEFRSERRYTPQTNVLETTFICPEGEVKLVDWLHMGARQSLCRLVTGLSGKVRMRAICEPRPDYGRRGPVSWSERMGYHIAQLNETHDIVLEGLAQPQSEFTLEPGDMRQISLTLHRPGPSDLLSSLERTVGFWEHWASDLKLPAVATEQVLRSALVLKGLQYQPSGAILAAPTTSLPEAVGGERNYDYRFSWIRDASFTLYALGRLGKDDEAQSWFDWLKWISLRSSSANLQILYGVEGERELEEFELAHLRGWRDSRPVRVGNAASDQRQLDTYGELLDVIWLQHHQTRKPLSRHRALFVRALAERALCEWREPDEGIWEVRGGPQHFVYSKVMCWVALDRAVRLARLNPEYLADAPIERWREVRDQIRADVLEHGYNAEVGAFTQAYGSRCLDASALLLAQVGFISARDERFVATVYAIKRELTEGGLVYRYRTDETDDGFSGTEASFTFCSFWLVLALTAIGELEEAELLFGRVLADASDLGLLAEELAADGEQLGNYPQAFSHIAVVACAFALEAAAEHGRAARDDSPAASELNRGA